MKRRAYLYFVITFLIGVVVGGVAVYTYAWNNRLWRRPWNEERALHNMQKELGLSPQQVEEVRSIWDQTRQQVHDIQAQSRPKLEALHQQTDERIRKILNPDQAKKLDEILQRRRRGPPPPSRH